MIAAFRTSWDDDYDERGHHVRHAGSAVVVGGHTFTVSSPGLADAVVDLLAHVEPYELVRLAATLSSVAFANKQCPEPAEVDNDG